MMESTSATEWGRDRTADLDPEWPLQQGSFGCYGWQQAITVAGCVWNSYSSAAMPMHACLDYARVGRKVAPVPQTHHGASVRTGGKSCTPDVPAWLYGISREIFDIIKLLNVCIE